MREQIPDHFEKPTFAGERWISYENTPPLLKAFDVKCPYAVGDRIWIREAWRTVRHYDQGSPSMLMDGLPIEYNATPEEWEGMGRWRNPLHLPRRFARPERFIITDIRAQRVQDIDNVDAIDEGCIGGGGPPDGEEPIDDFFSTWQALHPKKHTWADNPWVWAYTLEMVWPKND
jgi:hypothetical protein